MSDILQQADMGDRNIVLRAIVEFYRLVHQNDWFAATMAITELRIVDVVVIYGHIIIISDNKNLFSIFPDSLAYSIESKFAGDHVIHLQIKSETPMATIEKMILECRDDGVT